jgi:hypothetical protein
MRRPAPGRAPVYCQYRGVHARAPHARCAQRPRSGQLGGQMLAIVLSAAVASVSAMISTANSRVEPELILEPGSDWTVAVAGTDVCPTGDDGADSMPVAWRSPEDGGTTFFIAAVSAGIHAFEGPTLSSVRHKCGAPIFNSSFNETPESYANFQWLQAPHMFANGTGFGLVHNEFKSEFYPNASRYCSCDDHDHKHDCDPHMARCELWSTGLALTADGGRSWRLAAQPPQHLVAALPTRYVKDESVHGYGAISPILRGGDGAYYGLINIAGTNQAQIGGNCMFRSANPSDPASYRGWDGSNFTVKWQSPYTAAAGDDSVGPAGVCSTLPTNLSTPFSEHVCFRRMVPPPAGSSWVAELCGVWDRQWWGYRWGSTLLVLLGAGLWSCYCRGMVHASLCRTRCGTVDGDLRGCIVSGVTRCHVADAESRP